MAHRLGAAFFQFLTVAALQLPTVDVWQEMEEILLQQQQWQI